MRSGADLLEVGPANTAGMHSNQRLSWANAGDRHGLYANIIDAAIDSRLHVRGNCGVIPANRRFG